MMTTALVLVNVNSMVTTTKDLVVATVDIPATVAMVAMAKVHPTMASSGDCSLNCNCEELVTSNYASEKIYSYDK